MGPSTPELATSRLTKPASAVMASTACCSDGLDVTSHCSGTSTPAGCAAAAAASSTSSRPPQDVHLLGPVGRQRLGHHEPDAAAAAGDGRHHAVDAEEVAACCCCCGGRHGFFCWGRDCCCCCCSCCKVVAMAIVGRGRCSAAGRGSKLASVIVVRGRGAFGPRWPARSCLRGGPTWGSPLPSRLPPAAPVGDYITVRRRLPWRQQRLTHAKMHAGAEIYHLGTMGAGCPLCFSFLSWSYRWRKY